MMSHKWGGKGGCHSCDTMYGGLKKIAIFVSGRGRGSEWGGGVDPPPLMDHPDSHMGLYTLYIYIPEGRRGNKPGICI